MSVSSTSSSSSSSRSRSRSRSRSISLEPAANKHQRSKSKKNKERKENKNGGGGDDDKIDVLFEDCHWYDIPCPHETCYEKGVRFDCHDKFKLHHEQVHCPRGENGDIDRAKDSLRWQCPVITTREIEGIEYKERCNKISNSWYNYAGHITSHREIGHGWGCALPPQGKRKKTNRSHPNIKGLIVCGKRTSTKHHLLAHMNNVHKTYNVIDANGRQYNKKKDRKRYNKSKSTSPSTSASSTSRSRSQRKSSLQRRSTMSGTKRRRFCNLDEEKIHVLSQNKCNNNKTMKIKKEKGRKSKQINNNINCNALTISNTSSSSSQSQGQHQGLLQMALPQFSLPSQNGQLPLSSNNGNNGVTTNQQQGIPLIPQIPQIPHNLFQTNTNSISFGTPPSRKRMKLNPNMSSNMESTLPLNTNLNDTQTQQTETEQKCRLIPSSRGKQCGTDSKEQFDFLTLLCQAAEIHKGCNNCDRELIDYICKTEITEIEQDIEASLPSLPSLSAFNSINSINSRNSSQNSTLSTSSNNTSPSSTLLLNNNSSTNDSLLSTFSNSSTPSFMTAGNGNLPNSINSCHIMPKFPTIQSLFPSNFITLNTTLPTTMTNNVPFTFGVNQFQCSQNNNVDIDNKQLLDNNNANATENKSADQLLEDGIITSSIPKLPLMSQLQIN